MIPKDKKTDGLKCIRCGTIGKFDISSEEDLKNTIYTCTSCGYQGKPVPAKQANSNPFLKLSSGNSVADTMQMPSAKQADINDLNPKDLRKNRQRRGKNPLSENLLTQEDPDDVRNMSSKQVEANLVDERMKPKWIMSATQAIMDTQDLMKYERDILIKDLDKYYYQYKHQMPTDAVRNILRNKGIEASGNPFLKTSQMEMTMINPFVKPSKTEELTVVQAKGNPFLKTAAKDDCSLDDESIIVPEKTAKCKCGKPKSKCICDIGTCKVVAGTNPFIKKAQFTGQEMKAWRNSVMDKYEEFSKEKEYVEYSKSGKWQLTLQLINEGQYDYFKNMANTEADTLARTLLDDHMLNYKYEIMDLKRKGLIASANPFIKEAREFKLTDQQKKRKWGEDLLNEDKTKSDTSTPSNKAAGSDKVSPISPAFTDGTWKSYNWHTTFSPLDRLDARHAPNPVDFVPGYKEWYDREVDKYYDGWLNDHIENAGGSVPGSNTEKTMNLNDGEHNHPPVYPTEAPTEKMLETRHQFNDYETIIAANDKEYKFSLKDIETILRKNAGWLSKDPMDELKISEMARKVTEEAFLNKNESAKSLIMECVKYYAQQHPEEVERALSFPNLEENPVAPTTDDNLEDVMVNRLEREKQGDKTASAKKKIIK